MVTFISKITLTDQGMKDIRSTCKRAEDFKAAASGMGIEIRGLYWTMGVSDGCVIFDAPDDETAAKAAISINSAGAVRTQTVRAFTEQEFQKIIASLS